MSFRRSLPLLVIGFLVFAATGGALAQDGGPAAPAALAGTSFTYQGELTNGGSPVTGTCDFQFSLFDALSGGSQQGSTQTVTAVSVTNGRFTVTLNAAGQFGVRAFDGSARWLASAVKCPAGAGSFTALSPRQALTAAPLAFALPGLRTEQNATSPNVVGGYISNTVGVGVVGATIGGGGASGSANSVSGNYGAIGGGRGNSVQNEGTISGGISNSAGAGGAIGGGGSNNAGIAGAIAGGENNSAGYYGAVGGGFVNNASGENATVAGGNFNLASGIGSFIGGGGWDGTNSPGNMASGIASVVAGGMSNIASGKGSVVGGGGVDVLNGIQGNQARGTASTVAGGYGNVVTTTASYGTVGGGFRNTVTYINGTVGGGGNNIAGDTATVGGGGSNEATDFAATVSGGNNNTATASAAAIGGGEGNDASGDGATVSGGADNEASGSYATVSGGFENTALGDYSFAAGYGARAEHPGAFVWTCNNCPTTFSSADDQFVANAAGGFWFGDGGVTANGPDVAFIATDLISTSVGAHLTIGGVWTDNSDRNSKTNFAPADGEAILSSVLALPVQTWNYRAESASVRHIGPMAQDFYAAFGVGNDNTHIAALDTGGVALAAIQGLHAVVQEKDAEIAALTARVAALESATASEDASDSGNSAPAPTTNTLQLMVMLVIGLAAGAGLCLGAFALGRKQV